MYHTEPPTDKTIREWYMNSSRVAACALRNEQAVRAHGPLLNVDAFVPAQFALTSSWAVLLIRLLLFILQRPQKLGLNVYIRCVPNDRNCPIMILDCVTVTEGPSSTF